MADYKLREYSPLQLAYLGDAAYEFYIRKYLLRNNMISVNDLNKMAVHFVNASSQAVVAKKIEFILDDKELEFFRRGKNAKVSSSPKNSTIYEYKSSTAFESLIGMHIIDGNNKRAEYLMKKAVEILGGSLEK